MVATVMAVTLDVDIANTSTPTRIARARASIIGIVVPGVAVVAAMPTMTGRRRRRVSPAPRRPLCRQSRVKDFICRCSSFLSALQQGIAVSLQILVLLVRRDQCSKLLAHLRCNIIVLGNQITFHDAIEQLCLDVFAQSSFVR
jgi:hypothetical protein